MLNGNATKATVAAGKALSFNVCFKGTAPEDVLHIKYDSILYLSEGSLRIAVKTTPPTNNGKSINPYEVRMRSAEAGDAAAFEHCTKHMSIVSQQVFPYPSLPLAQ